MKFPVPIRKAVEKMRAYNPPLEGRTKKMRLDFNENPIGCSPKVRQALAKLTAAEICSYPEQETVRRQVAKHFGVRPDELLLSNGTDEALHVIVSTFVEPDDSVLIVDPTYAMYRFYSELAGARVLAPRYTADMEFPWDEVLVLLAGNSNPEGAVGCDPERAKRRGISLRAVEEPEFPLRFSSGHGFSRAANEQTEERLQPLRSRVSDRPPRAKSPLGGRSFSSDITPPAGSGALAPEEETSAASVPPRVFFLPNPNSPTGNLLPPSEIRRILDAAKQTMVVIDEAYFEFSGVTVIPWIRRHANLIVTRTFSKTAGLAGLRLGCIFVDRDLAATMRKSQSPYPVNAAALAAAEAAMRDRAFIARTVREVKAGRTQLERGLTRLGVRYFPSGGNFILVYFGDRAKKIVAALDRKGILLRDRSGDFSGDGYVRITVGTPPQIARLLRALEALL
jgi:histidinol-phosphate/aromatic aminotransferase/cobyric acid decarboxylase-like protein